MVNPYESPSSTEASRARSASSGSWRVAAALPLLLLGLIWCLSLFQLPDVLAEVSERGKAQGTSEDIALGVSLWRGTVLPACRLGFIVAGFGVFYGKWKIWLTGLLGTTIFFVAGPSLVRLIF